MQQRNNETVAAKVRGIAAERRLKQADLADMLHLSRMAIYRRMCGEVPFSVAELILISEQLNVPVGAFFGEAIAA